MSTYNISAHVIGAVGTGVNTGKKMTFYACKTLLDGDTEPTYSMYPYTTAGLVSAEAMYKRDNNNHRVEEITLLKVEVNIVRETEINR